jgi:hypothetical protein
MGASYTSRLTSLSQQRAPGGKPQNGFAVGVSVVSVWGLKKTGHEQAIERRTSRSNAAKTALQVKTGKQQDT